jgi:hypothetical protein
MAIITNLKALLEPEYAQCSQFIERETRSNELANQK